MVIKQIASSLRHPGAETKKTCFTFFGLLLAYMLIIGVLYPGLISRFSSQVPFGSAADLKFILSIIDFSIHSSVRDLYNFPMFYPESGSLVRTHPLFGISLFYKVFRWLGLNLEQSTNLYIIMGLLVGALGCFLFAREVSGNAAYSFVFSVLSIVHHKNLLHFAWLDFFSRFYVPLILYFLLRFFRSGRHRWAAAAAGLVFLEFLACLYVGTIFGAFLLPAFILFAWWLRLVDWRGLLKTIAWFALALALVVAVFHPYLVESMAFDHVAKDQGVSPADLFQSWHGSRSWLGGPKIRSEALFPGLAAMACFVLFFVPLRGKRRWAVFLLLFAPVPVLAVWAFSPGLLFEALFLVWAIMLAVALGLEWREIKSAERLAAVTFALFLLVNLEFRFLPILKSVPLYSVLASLLPPIRGLRMIDRGFLIVLPLVTAMAAAGAVRHLPQLARKRRMRPALAALLVLMAAENVSLLNILSPGRIMEPIPYLDSAAYHSLPFRSDLVILEIPHYFPRPVRNAQYLLNWRFHQNYLLNGKGRIRPVQYRRKLARIIGQFQGDFPTDSQLRRLLQNYSVGRVIIHWKALQAYQHGIFDRKRTWSKIQGLKSYGRVEAADERTVLIAVQELIPVAAIIRTYSDFHLRRHPLYVKLKGQVPASVSVRLNGREVSPPRVSGCELLVDLRHEPLQKTGNRVEIHLAQAQTLETVKLWPEKAPLPF
jgi:hypothetical protein